MDNRRLRSICIVVTLLIGNSVYMMLLGPRRLSDDTYNTINDMFGSFLSDLISIVGEGIFIIISYTIIMLIVFKLFPIPEKIIDSESMSTAHKEIQNEETRE